MLRDLLFLVFVLALALAILIGLLRLLFPLPKLKREVSQSVLFDGHRTPLGELIHSPVGEESFSGIHSLFNPREAFAARMMLARSASKTIDAQYYIWHHDLSGRLLISELLLAADRGVRVRLLLDDNCTTGEDDMLRAAACHPNFHIRLFNPFIIRTPRLLNYLMDFHRLNRRMHNKSFTADRIATIVGGRNVGNEYFAASEGMQFADADVLCVGHAAAAVTENFERYWECGSSYEVETIIGKALPQLFEKFRRELQNLATSKIGKDYVKLISKINTLDRLKNGTITLEWVPTMLLSDHPAKGLSKIRRGDLMATKLYREIETTKTNLDFASAYFVPGHLGVNALAGLTRRGIKVRALTNSLASNNVSPVHAGYARYRRQMLKSGIQLFELKPNRTKEQNKALRGQKTLFGRFGASSACLHAKVFIMDDSRVLISSFNFDPRSINLNCEMGLLFESSKYARAMKTQIAIIASKNAYVPILQGNSLRWKSSSSPDAEIFKQEPETTLWQRNTVRLLQLIPIEWLL